VRLTRDFRYLTLKGLSSASTLLIALIAATGSARGQSTLEVLHLFHGGNDGATPSSSVTLGPGGSIYGTTQYGGPSNDGTVFYISPGGREKVLHSFTGGADGTIPAASLVELGGSFYGTTTDGGASGLGTIFKVDPTGAETVVHAFTGLEGSYPYATLIRDQAGNLYGTATDAGPAYCGTVYRFDSTGAVTVLYSFTGGLDGSLPYGKLVRDAAGNLYGTTDFGGAYGLGVVFKVDPTGAETVLHDFAGPSNGDGLRPITDLIQDPAGNLYGTAQGGSADNGIVFKVDPLGNETVLYNFTGGATDGGFASKSIVRDSSGNIYGTVSTGAAFGYGGVFMIDASGDESLLYSFTGTSQGGSGGVGVVRDTAGNLYGTTANNRHDNFGMVYKLTFP
jgi:uncharacterized repeat protein (TIGR03803 family)